MHVKSSVYARINGVVQKMTLHLVSLFAWKPCHLVMDNRKLITAEEDTAKSEFRQTAH